MSTACGAEESRKLAIVYSGSANGILSSCHCPNSPWGGLAKRAWLLDQLRTVAGSNRVLALDSGDLFPLDPVPGRAPLMLQLFALMDYQAVGIGEQELAQGLDVWIEANRSAGFWNETIGRATFPWLSGGYRLTEGPRQQQMLVPPWTTVDCNGVRVGMVSVAGPEAWRYARAQPANLELVAPERIIAAFQEQTQAQLDLAIVLSHQGLDADRELAQRISGIDLIIGGHSQSLVSPPEIVNGIAICQAGKNGENLGILVIMPRSTTGTKPVPHAEHDAAIAAGEVSNDPFLPAVVQTPRWTIAQQIVPLTTAIEDSEPAAQLIAAYYAKLDDFHAQQLAAPAPESQPDDPQLVLYLPSGPLVLAAGEKKTVEMRISNPGGAPLKIERVRSKNPWLTVREAPASIAPGAEAKVVFEVAAEKIDRFFRCEFSIWASDPHRRVVQAAFPGRVEGPLPGILDVAALWSNLAGTACASLPAATKPEAAVDGSGPAPNPIPDPLIAKSLAIPPAAVVEDIGRANRPGEPELTNIPPATQDPVSSRRVLVEFFFAPGCTECKEVEHLILPAVLDRFGAAVDFRMLDVSVPSNYLRLATLQDRLVVRANKPVSIYVDETVALLGLDSIQTDLEHIVAERLTASGTERTAALSATPDLSPESAPVVLSDRLHSFTLPAMLLAGLVDGINPCAFATIVFFITLLGVSGMTGRRLLPVGTGYALAVFGTYLLMGLGAFQAIHTLQGWTGLAEILRWTMLAVLVLLALLSFRDALKFKYSGRATDVALQLPDRLKRRIHDTMRSRLNPASLFWSAAGIGVIVTLIETVCTGQVYLPTLVLLSRYTETRVRAIPLLLLYNLMFILPLLAVILAAFLGTRNQRLLDWSRQNVVWGKTAMGLLFAALAVALVLT